MNIEIQDPIIALTNTLLYMQQLNAKKDEEINSVKSELVNLKYDYKLLSEQNDSFSNKIEKCNEIIDTLTDKCNSISTDRELLKERLDNHPLYKWEKYVEGSIYELPEGESVLPIVTLYGTFSHNCNYEVPGYKEAFIMNGKKGIIEASPYWQDANHFSIGFFSGFIPERICINYITRYFEISEDYKPSDDVYEK